jgi:hypothetical protein
VSLRSGLVLGSEELLNRVRALLDGKGGEEEVRWTAREEDAEGRIALARDLAERQAERVWQVWVRVRLGAERRIDVARAYGYKDGSAITQILKRLEHDTKTKSEKQLRMSKLRKTFAGLSSVRS